MSEKSYVYDQGWREERARLAALGQLYDEGTFRLLERLGVAAGWRCLEVGAGEGSVARWMADRVGPSGQVLAIDLDPRFLEPGGHLDVHQHDILDGPPAKVAYDLVHARAVIEWIADRPAALANMLASLKPGGLILVEDVDIEIGVFGNPDSDVRAKLIAAIGELAAAGGADLTFGRKLPMMMQNLGLTQIGVEARCTVQCGGDPSLDFQRLTLEQLGPTMVALGHLTQEELDEGLRELDDPERSFYPPLMVSVWGSTPAG